MSTTKPPPGFFNLLYFASASSYTEKASEHVPAPLELTKLFEALEERYPGMRENVLSSCAVTVNLEYVDLDIGSEPEETTKTAKVIQEGDEVAIIPPVSSG